MAHFLKGVLYMEDNIRRLIRKLHETHSLSTDEYETLIRDRDEEARTLLAELAVQTSRSIYGNEIFSRGLIEICNICRNNCAEEGYGLGFRTFVLQGGEDGYYTDDVLCAVVRELKRRHPDCAVTLSMGERSRESYARLREAGADRYLLRHETAD